MRLRFLYAALPLALAVFLLLHFHHQTSAAPAPRPDGPPPPVLVELFTSEGCSSCPPADALLKRLSEAQSVAGVQVIALEEHVDYWNHLGWADPFSASTFTQRQDEYAHVFGNDSVYTPQMVVDGQFELVGSRGEEARKAIHNAAARPKLEIALRLSPKSTPEKPVLEIHVSNPRAVSLRDSPQLWIALTETNLQSDVKAGENSGEVLQHAAVVRSFRKFETIHDASGYQGDLTLSLDPHWKRDNLSAVVFVSEKDSHKVIGAGVMPLHP